MTPDTLFTWQSLATLAGAALLVYFIVQYTKNMLPKVIPTDLYAVGIGFVVLLLSAMATMETVKVTWQVVILSLFNGFLVAAAAGQMFNKAINPPAGNTIKASQEAAIIEAPANQINGENRITN